MKHKNLKDNKDISTLNINPRVTYFPVFLNLKGKNVLVIGGGRVSERKVLSLLRSGANVTVISPQITKRLEKERSLGNLKHISREYKKGDSQRAFLTIAATDSIVTNRNVSKDAPCLINVVDSPSLCNFIVPSIIRRGSLTIAISTNGISPALSKSIRKELERFYTRDFSKYLRLLEKIRKRAIREIKDIRKRRQLLKGIAEERIVRTLREKGIKEVKNDLAQSIKKFKIIL
ncbi:MAG: bifunctional precorrin-2 dehydrogenase/sirohydrochlorin ferrochelatase [Nitrospirae bacterium]|nr:bifunctional precorrin-2 dehydrogenase/sirohydrochlorin ferrochelatase [Nitrospirota bacterium]